MPDENYYLDNADLKFQMEQIVDWPAIFALKEKIGTDDCPFATVAEAKAGNLDMLATPVGELAAQRIAPRAADVDREGCRLVDGEVIFPDGLKRNLQDLREAQLCGITLHREYGGLGFSKTFYAAATEIISRADASLMNFFGLQGIAETIQQFASPELAAEILPAMASGERTGAMVLTEPDAGSDLAAIRTKADLQVAQDPATGEWRMKGTKRFITNGCGDVHVVLARSEDPGKFGGGRGLSMFLVEKSARLKVRRIEEKMGIHGSPTCELYFDDTPARLIGQRGRGLTRYTSWLMLEARLAVAAQALGICEAARREAERYASEREQFGKKIAAFPAVAAMLTDMRVYTEAARALLFATSQYVDLHEGAERRELKAEVRQYEQATDVLTPMAKYYITELANHIASLAIQVHGGNGFMKDYAVERLYRDARITNIYEGTSQIQVGWAMPRLLKGALDPVLAKVSSPAITDAELAPLAAQVQAAQAILQECIVRLKERPLEYRELLARRLVDIAVDVYVGWLFLRQAEKWDYKRKVARRFIADLGPRVRMNREYIFSDRPVELEYLA